MQLVVTAIDQLGGELIKIKYLDNTSRLDRIRPRRQNNKAVFLNALSGGIGEGTFY